MLLLPNVNKYEDARTVKIVVTVASVGDKMTLQIPKRMKFHTKHRLRKGTRKKAKHLQMAHNNWCLASRISAEQLTIFADISIARSSKKLQIMKTTDVERAQEEGDFVHVSHTTDCGNVRCI